MAFVYRLSMFRSSTFTSCIRYQASWNHYIIGRQAPASLHVDYNISQCRHSSTESPHPLSKRVKDTANVVIIGGGVIGTSVAYHLAKADIKDVVLLEKTELTAGSTWHAAGLTTYFSHSFLDRRLNAMTINLFQHLEEETGQKVGFHNPGTIRLITSPIRYEEALYEQSLSNWMPHPSRVISAEQVAKLHPFLNMDMITGGLYTVGDGHVDPYSLTQAYATGARQHGAEIFLKSPVTSLEQRTDGGWNVQTDHGTINAKTVINSAGVWAREVYQLAGIDVPITNTQHQYVVTSSIPEVEALGRELPVLRDLDGSYYLRQERTGLLIGPYESKDEMKLQEEWFDKGVTKGFGRELFESDLDRISSHLERAMEICPLLKKADIQTVITGPMPSTPDFYGLLGPYLGLDNFWCCSSQIGGVCQSGGVAQVITAWIRDGEPPFDVSAMDPNRFDNWMTRDHAIAMSRETYGYSNHVVYPKFPEEHFVLERPTQRASGIYEKLKGRGAQYGFVAGWEKPLWFAQDNDQVGFQPCFQRANWFQPVQRECELVTNSVGIIDLTPCGKFEVTGRDAAEFLDELVAGDIPKTGFAGYGYVLSPECKVMSELGINRFGEDHFFLVTSAKSELHDLRWMLQQKKSRKNDVNIRNVTDDMACLGIAGPDSDNLLTDATSSDLQTQHILPEAVKEIDICGVHMKAVKTSYTGECGWELYHAKSDTLRLYDALLKAGKAYSVNDFGWYALNVLRLERGFPAVHSELCMDYNALEADIGSVVNIEKTANFTGKAALSSLHKTDRSTKKRAFIVIRTEGPNDPNGFETVWNELKAVGYTTSGCHSFRIGKGIAFAYVPPKLAEPGTRLEVEIQGKLAPAVVTYPPASENYIDFDI